MPRPLKLSARAQALQPSLTLAIAARAKALKADGRDICSLSAGEPDFDTPDFIRQAAAQALESGLTRYGPAAGEPALREAIAQKLTQENLVPTSADQVLVTNGGKQALYNLFQVLLEPGDELLLPVPYWLSYPEMARLAGASVRLIPSSAAEGFRLDPERLEAAITPASKLLVLNSPGNPTGTVLSRRPRSDRRGAPPPSPGSRGLRRDLRIPAGPGHSHHSFAAVAPTWPSSLHSEWLCQGLGDDGLADRLVAGNSAAIKAASALQSQSTSNVCTFAQYGALAAITGSRECVRTMAAQFTHRRQLLSDGLQAINGVQLLPPQGAFYAFPNINSSGLDSMVFCERLLEEQGLAVVPGGAFGDNDCIRLSCAASDATIEDGLARLRRFIESLS